MCFGRGILGTVFSKFGTGTGDVKATLPDPEFFSHSEYYMDNLEAVESTKNTIKNTQRYTGIFNDMVLGMGIFTTKKTVDSVGVTSAKYMHHQRTFDTGFNQGTFSSAPDHEKLVRAMAHKPDSKGAQMEYYKVKKKSKPLGHVHLECKTWVYQDSDFKEHTLKLNLVKSKNSPDLEEGTRDALLMLLQYSSEDTKHYGIFRDPLGYYFRGLYYLLYSQAMHSMAYMNSLRVFPTKLDLSLPNKSNDYLTVLQSVEQL